jgi:phosphatidylglycerophosphatase A
VWDEFIGVWIALAWLPTSGAWIIAGFILFRFLDIWKPWPISWLDRHVHGGLGIIIDDVLAGFFTLAILQIARALI